jgi:hypothetical protein
MQQPQRVLQAKDSAQQKRIPVRVNLGFINSFGELANFPAQPDYFHVPASK